MGARPARAGAAVALVGLLALARAAGTAAIPPTPVRVAVGVLVVRAGPSPSARVVATVRLDQRFVSFEKRRGERRRP